MRDTMSIKISILSNGTKFYTLDTRVFLFSCVYKYFFYERGGGREQRQKSSNIVFIFTYLIYIVSWKNCTFK